MQEGILKVAAEAAVQRREAAEAAATPEERIVLQHAKALKAQELRKKEVSLLFYTLPASPFHCAVSLFVGTYPDLSNLEVSSQQLTR